MLSENEPQTSTHNNDETYRIPPLLAIRLELDIINSPRFTERFSLKNDLQRDITVLKAYGIKIIKRSTKILILASQL